MATLSLRIVYIKAATALDLSKPCRCI